MIGTAVTRRVGFENNGLVEDTEPYVAFNGANSTSHGSSHQLVVKRVGVPIKVLENATVYKFLPFTIYQENKIQQILLQHCGE